MMANQQPKKPEGKKDAQAGMNRPNADKKNQGQQTQTGKGSTKNPK